MISRTDIEQGNINEAERVALSADVAEMLDNVVKINGAFQDAKARFATATADVRIKATALAVAEATELEVFPRQNAVDAIKEVQRARTRAKLNSFGYDGDGMIPEPPPAPMPTSHPKHAMPPSPQAARKAVELASVAYDNARAELAAATVNLKVWTARTDEAFALWLRANLAPTFEDIHRASVAAYKKPEPKPSNRVAMSRLDALYNARSAKKSVRRDPSQLKPRGLPMEQRNAVAAVDPVNRDSAKGEGY